MHPNFKFLLWVLLEEKTIIIYQVHKGKIDTTFILKNLDVATEKLSHFILHLESMASFSSITIYCFVSLSLNETRI